MATTTTSSNFSTSNTYIKYRIVVTENSTDLDDNTSNVTVKVQAWRTNTGYETYGSGTCYVTIDGTSYTQSITSSQKITYNSYTTLFTRTLNIEHNDNGTKSIYVSSYISHSRFTSSSQGFTVNLTDIPRQATIVSAPNFTDEQNPTITYQNTAGTEVTSLQACISLTGSNDDIEYRDISKTGTSYTFSLTTAERNILRNASPNSNTLSVIFYVKTVLNGNTYYSTLTRTMTIVNAKPTISSITYEDTNSTVTNVTQNNQQIVRNLSNLELTISTLNALKGSSLSSANVTINGITKSFTGISGTSLSSATLDFGTINVANNINATITITDTRGNYTTYTKAITVLDYQSPYANITLQRQSNFYTNTDLTVNASYSSLDNKNSINIQYQTKKASETNYGTLTTISNNTLTTIELDNSYEWNVKVIIKDIFNTTVSYILYVDRGIPQVFYDRILRSTGINCFPINQNSLESEGLQVDDKIYIGSQVIYDSGSLTTEGTQIVLGSYDYGLIDNLFTGVTIPDDYEKGYRISAQISTNGGNYASVMVNNIETYRLNTWSSQTYRKVVSSPYFKQSDITLETTFNYSKPGTNLKLKNTYTAGSGNAYFWNVTVHAYLIKKATQTETTISYDDEPEPTPAT